MVSIFEVRGGPGYTCTISMLHFFGMKNIENERKKENATTKTTLCSTL